MASDCSQDQSTRALAIQLFELLQMQSQITASPRRSSVTGHRVQTDTLPASVLRNVLASILKDFHISCIGDVYSMRIKCSHATCNIDLNCTKSEDFAEIVVRMAEILGQRKMEDAIQAKITKIHSAATPSQAHKKVIPTTIVADQLPTLLGDRIACRNPTVDEDAESSLGDDFGESDFDDDAVVTQDCTCNARPRRRSCPSLRDEPVEPLPRRASVSGASLWKRRNGQISEISCVLPKMTASLSSLSFICLADVDLMDISANVSVSRDLGLAASLRQFSCNGAQPLGRDKLLDEKCAARFELNKLRVAHDLMAAELSDTDLVSTAASTPMAVTTLTDAASRRWKSKSETVIVLDWDNTLCPTTVILKDLQWYMSGSRCPCFDDPSLPLFLDHCTPIEQLAARGLSLLDALQRHEAAAQALLESAAELGNVVIITLAKRGWVSELCDHLFPSLGKTMQTLGIECIYARDSLRPRQIKHGIREEINVWQLLKETAMRRAIGSFYRANEDQSWKNIVGIGDQWTDAHALSDATFSHVQQADSAAKLRLKSIKLLEDPGMLELTCELERVRGHLADVVGFDGDLSMELDSLSSADGMVVERILRHPEWWEQGFKTEGFSEETLVDWNGHLFEAFRTFRRTEGQSSA